MTALATDSLERTAAIRSASLDGTPGSEPPSSRSSARPGIAGVAARLSETTEMRAVYQLGDSSAYDLATNSPVRALIASRLLVRRVSSPIHEARLVISEGGQGRGLQDRVTVLG